MSRTDRTISPADGGPDTIEIGNAGAEERSSAPPPSSTSRKLSWWDRARRDKVLLLMAIPGLGLLLAFHYLPLLGNVIAFKDYPAVPRHRSTAPGSGWTTSG